VALHFEVPVVATDTGGLREVVEQADIGLIAPSTEPGAIAGAIQQCFRDKAPEAMAANIRTYKDSHSWKEMARQIGSFTAKLGSGQD
jgi:glycosyltransferase involved in cell wall biosynthesis